MGGPAFCETVTGCENTLSDARDLNLFRNGALSDDNSRSFRLAYQIR